MPAPFGPITATRSPRPAASETPRNATRSPKRLTRSRASSTGATACGGLWAALVSTAISLAESSAVKLLFVGDVVGGVGRRTLAALLPMLRDRHRPDFVIVNGENAAGGVGITERTARELFDQGVDAITLGNHAYRHREVYAYLDREERIVRPANYPRGSPGRGHTLVRRDGLRLAVINLSGTLFMEAARSPFGEVDAVLAELRGKADHVIVDMHAEATSEKVAMGWHLDGRATACVGTHTHVPTADAHVLPDGTAYVTDVGMTGARGGVIGVKREQALERFLTLTHVRFETSREDPWLNAVLIQADGAGRATSIDQLLLPGAGAGFDRSWEPIGAEAGDQDERHEPDHVEVEPVGRGDLHEDQQRRGEGGDLSRIRTAGPQRQEQRERRHGRLHGRLKPLERGRLTPDAERRGATRLVTDRAVVELSQTAVGDEWRHHKREREHEARANGERCTPCERRQDDRGELDSRPSGDGHGGAKRGAETSAGGERKQRADAGEATSESFALVSSTKEVYG